MDSREVIASAAVELVAEGGLEAVSVRAAATRAGVSPGLVQHHFGTKQALLLAAMHLVGQRLRTRVAAAAAADPASSTDPGRRLRLLAEQLLPLDDQRRTEARVWLAFVARAAVDGSVAQVHAQEWRALQDVLAGLLAARRETDGPAGDGAVDPSGRAADVAPQDLDDAARLLAALDGMAVSGVTEPGRMDAARLSRLLDQLLL